MANTVLITGASRGIGAATARYFGEQGWQVAVHYHEREDLALELVRELREMGTCAVALGADLGLPGSGLCPSCSGGGSPRHSGRSGVRRWDRPAPAARHGYQRR